MIAPRLGGKAMTAGLLGAQVAHLGTEFVGFNIPVRFGMAL